MKHCGFILDKQRTISLRAEDNNTFTLCITSSTPEAIADIETMQKSTVFLENGKRVTVLGLWPDTLEQLIFAWAHLMIDENLDVVAINVVTKPK